MTGFLFFGIKLCKFSKISKKEIDEEKNILKNEDIRKSKENIVPETAREEEKQIIKVPELLASNSTISHMYHKKRAR